MLDQVAFCVEGLISEVMPNTLFLVKLGNGHSLIGHVTASQKPLAQGLQVGVKVRIKLSPCDLSQGRVILNEDKL